MQRDVHVGSAAALNRTLVQTLRDSGVLQTAPPDARRVYELMAGWDGQYAADSQAPVAFELFRFHFTRHFYQSVFGDTDWSAFAGVGGIKTLLIEDIRSRPPQAMAPLLRRSLDAAAERLDRFPTWGDMHRLQLRHPLAFLPVVGDRYVFADHPVGGSTDSLMKTAHGSTDERHRASYGANARHISDLADADANWFVLLGGQDGWLNSATFLDQVPLWLEGRYVQMPLRPETVRRQFTRMTELKP
jgi:penicillin amidase